MGRHIQRFITASCILILTGCAALGNYTIRTEPARISVAGGRFEDALKIFPAESAKGKNEVLIRMERGALLQAAGRYEQSAEELEAATSLIRKYEDKALISASRTASQAGSLIINEQMLSYEGEDFEKILIHGLDATNYLMMGDLEGARVEIRNAYTRQKQLYERHERKLDKAMSENRGVSWQDAFRKADRKGFEGLKQRAASVTSVYQNAFAYYISSVVYELNNEPDEAYIDLKKAITAAPDSRSIQKDLIRLSRKLGYFDDLEKWERAYGKAGKADKGGVDVFVIFGFGTAPVKDAVSFPIPIRRGGFVFASLPVYRFVQSPILSGRVVYNGRSEQTSLVSDTDAIAARNLLDEFPVLFIKQVARSYLKAQATNRMSKEYGAAGAIGGTLISAVTEQADLRTWSMLPKQIHVARVFVPGDTRRVTIQALPAGTVKAIEIPRGKNHVVVLCRATNTGLFVDQKAY